MKKKLILKLIVDIVILILIAISIFYISGVIKNILYFKELLTPETEIAYKNVIWSYTKLLFYYLFVVAFCIFAFIFVNFTDLSCFKNSIAKTIHEHRQYVAHTREEKKQALKQKKIAELEKELSELKKDE